MNGADVSAGEPACEFRVAGVSRLGDLSQRRSAAGVQHEMRRGAVIGVRLEGRPVFRDQEVGDPLHVLPGDAEATGDLRGRQRRA